MLPRLTDKSGFINEPPLKRISAHPCSKGNLFPHLPVKNLESGNRCKFQCRNPSLLPWKDTQALQISRRFFSPVPSSDEVRTRKEQLPARTGPTLSLRFE